MATLMITGGSGFLGYHLCNKLGKKFSRIFVVDPAPLESGEYPKNVEYLNMDIVNKTRLESIIKQKKPDFIIHAAAALPLYPKEKIWAVNVRGTRNVLEIALENKTKRVVFISSTAVYGVPDKHPLYETDELVGVGPYGETKIVAEKICEEFRRKGLCVPVIRPKTFIGFGRLGVFQILYDWVENGRKVPIIGNGKNRYQLLDVEDLVDSIYLMISQDREKVNDTFNVGAKRFKTVYEDVSALCSYAGSGARVMRTPARFVKLFLIVAEKMRLSPLYKWVYGTADKDSFVSIEKIEKRFNWEPKFSNAETLIKSYKWYIEHKKELSGTGITHRVAWSQGILKLVKKLM